MTINNYVAAAYAVFATVLAWDYLAPRIRLGQIRRAIALRARREATKKSDKASH